MRNWGENRRNVETDYILVDRSLMEGTDFLMAS